MDPRERLDDPEETLRLAIQGALSNVWTALPAVVVNFKPAQLTVDVQPTIKIIQQNQDGSFQAVQMPLLLDCPVVFQRGGGATLTFPIAAGDECMVVFMNRNMDGWFQSGGVQLPLSARRFDLSDGMALVGPFSKPNAIEAYSATEVQLRNDAGDAFFSLNPATGKARIVAPGGLDIVANIAHTGNQNSSGTVTAAQVVGGGTDLHSHIHSGVQPGGGNSGPPV